MLVSNKNDDFYFYVKLKMIELFLLLAVTHYYFSIYPTSQFIFKSAILLFGHFPLMQTIKSEITIAKV